MNFLHGSVSLIENAAVFTESMGKLKIPVTAGIPPGFHGNEIILGIRPHHIHLRSQEETAQYRGEVVVYESLGEEGVLEVKVADSILVAQTASDLGLRCKDPVTIGIDWQHAVFFDADTGGNINQADGKRQTAEEKRI